MQFLHLLLSIFSVIITMPPPYGRCGSETASAQCKELNMRIVETVATGLVGLAAQLLVVAIVLM
jgi:hypothetical protein